MRAFWLAVLVAVVAVGWPATAAPTADDLAVGRASQAAWERARDQELRRPDDWLTLAGLFWLEVGDATLGCAPENHFVLPVQLPVAAKPAPVCGGGGREEDARVTPYTFSA